MSASLVGSEMCIRDSASKNRPPCPVAIRHRQGPAGPIIASHSGGGSGGGPPAPGGSAPRRWAKAAR
eukprot:7238369-Alexandrium_andersonii.AAC.1